MRYHQAACTANKPVQVLDSSQEKNKVCGADAFAKFMRDNFGIDYAREYGFKMSINLKMSVEALLEYDLC